MIYLMECDLLGGMLHVIDQIFHRLPAAYAFEALKLEIFYSIV